MGPASIDYTVSVFLRDKLFVLAQLSSAKFSHHLSAFIDSGAASSFIDRDLADRLQIPVTKVHRPFSLLTVDNSSLSMGMVTLCNVPVTLTIGEFHMETISFYLISSPAYPLILGYPWIKLRNLHIDWATKKIRSWSQTCNQNCIKTVDQGVCGQMEI